MIRYPLKDAMNNRKLNKGGVKYPDIEDPRCQDGMLFPAIRPGFSIVKGQRIFTMGSCFARNIERQLKGFELPSRNFTPVADDPLAVRGNTVLNEYNPGTMAQRIRNAIAGVEQGMECVFEEPEGYCDYFITGGEAAPLEIVLERRKRIEAVYRGLPGADLMIITLGLTETWFDTETGQYLNRAPGPEYMRAATRGPSRFELRILNVQDCFDLLAPAFDAAFSAGLKNVMLTVSPVPLQRSFSTHDAVIANTTSKSTLRVTADLLCQEFPQMDYFPSYEMVTTLLGNPFGDDNVHVRNDVVERVTRYMVEAYSPEAAS